MHNSYCFLYLAQLKNLLFDVLNSTPPTILDTERQNAYHLKEGDVFNNVELNFLLILNLRQIELRQIECKKMKMKSKSIFFSEITFTEIQH